MAFLGMWVGHTVRGEQRLKAFLVPAAPLLRLSVPSYVVWDFAIACASWNAASSRLS